MSILSPKKTDEKNSEMEHGCKHYSRKCAFVSPCCDKVYTCRVCHDESEAHEINRKLINKIKCLICQCVQGVNEKCESCNTVFANYYCPKCRLYDDANKGQFHCEGCGLCRIGGRENFFHCEKCDMCLSVKLKGHHKCVEESSRRNCAICLEDLHTSRIDGHIPPCGHLIHRACFEQCVKTGNYACPTCAESLLNMRNVWEQLDAEVANTPMPEEYKQFYVFVLCRDCHKESKVLFHVIGLKCDHCGSYNTCRTADKEGATPDPSTEPGANPGSSENRASPLGADSPTPGSSDTSPPAEESILAGGDNAASTSNRSSQNSGATSQQTLATSTTNQQSSGNSESQAEATVTPTESRVTSRLTMNLQSSESRQPPDGASDNLDGNSS